MTTGTRHSVSVAAIIVDDGGRVLMIQRRDNGKWEPPGGILELDESVPDGLRREVFEETGLHIQPDRLTGVYKNMTRGVIALVFRAHIITGSPADSTDETVCFAWLTPDQIRQRCDPAFAIRVVDALPIDGSAAIRSHDGINLTDQSGTFLEEPATGGGWKEAR